MKKIILLPLLLIFFISNFFACSKDCKDKTARVVAPLCTAACATLVTYGALAGNAGTPCIVFGSIGIAGCGCCTILAYCHPHNERRIEQSNRPAQTAPTTTTSTYGPPHQIQMRNVPQQPLSEDPRNP